MAFAGAGLKASPSLSSVAALAATDPLITAFLAFRRTLTRKESSLSGWNPPLLHSQILFPPMHTKLVTTMKMVNIFFSVGLREQNK